LNFYGTANSKASAGPRRLRSIKDGAERIIRIEDEEAMQFEGGSREEADIEEEIKDGSGRQQPSLGDTEKQDDGMLNEDDVRLALKDVTETESIQMTP